MIDASSSNAEKVRLFRSLFAGREDVFARRYENVKKGTSGYSPYCQTKDRFRMRERLPIPCGANTFIEVALVSEQDKLVIQLDKHKDLTSSDYYRQICREDMLMQSKGYRIIHFLSEDVCPKLDAVLNNVELFLDKTI